MILRGRTRRSGLSRGDRENSARSGGAAVRRRTETERTLVFVGARIYGRRLTQVRKCLVDDRSSVGDDEPPCDPRPVAILCSGCWELWAMSTNRWRWRPPASAPPRFDQRLAAVYLLLVVPAVVGAALDWPEALTFALIVPGLLGHMRLSIGSARAQGVDARGERPPPGFADTPLERARCWGRHGHTRPVWRARTSVGLDLRR